MAFTIPETIAAQAKSSTFGERKVFTALRDDLPEDYLVYYDIPVNRRYPDFIIIGPDLGLVVLEVKDWRLDSIAEVRPDGVVLRGAESEITLKNPMQQAREYALTAVDTLKKRSLLFDGEKLRFGWAYGVIFPLMKKKDVETPSLFGPSLEVALGPGLVLTGDDLTAKSLLPRLKRLFPSFAVRLEPLNPIQMDEIRGVLYPEIRIGWNLTDADILRVMDREQERLARILGEGHRLLRGVAGSGKTVTLICRAHHLRQRHPDWRVLVLCFNRVLADCLRQAIEPDPVLEVLHFHRWCRRELEAAKVEIPEPPAPGERDDYWDREVPQLLIQAYEEGRLQPGAYQAILVDEGQDFNDGWYRAVLRALDPKTNSLFIALDSSQNIYKRKVSWRDLGIQAIGRTRVLSVNYRNTAEILSAAYRMIQALDSAGAADREPEAEYVTPDRALRHGPSVEVIRFGSAEESRRHALEWIRKRLSRGVAPEEILILRLKREDLLYLETWLEDAGVTARLLGGKGVPGDVRLSTIHSAKGLDAEHVLLLGAHQLAGRDEAQERRLLYIAMTRARTELCISYYGESVLMTHLAKSC